MKSKSSIFVLKLFALIALLSSAGKTAVYDYPQTSSSPKEVKRYP